MGCTGTIQETELTKRLREKVGVDDIRYASIITSIYNNETLDQKFVDWCIANNKNNQYFDNIGDVDFDTTTGLDKLVKAVLDYYNTVISDVNYTSNIQKDSTSVGLFGYSSVDARDFAKKYVVNILFDIHYQSKYGLLHEPAKSKDDYIDMLLTILEEELYRKINPDATVSELEEFFSQEDIISELDKLFEDASYQNRNLLALYKEIIADTDNFIKELFDKYNKALSSIKLGDNNTEDIIQETLETQEISPENSANINESVEEIEASKDLATSGIINKDNILNNTLSHLNDGIKSYLSTIPKLNSVASIQGKRDYNTSNPLGVVEYMDLHEIMNILYSGDIDYTNVDSMIESFKTIAKRVPNFAGLQIIAEDLSNIENQDIAYDLYKTFSKLSLQVMETLITDKVGEVKTNNRQSDKLTALRFEYFNSIKTTTITNEADRSYKLYNETIKDLDNTDFNNNEQLKALVNKVADLLKLYYPTIDSQSISNFVYFNENENTKEINKKNNIISLLNSFKNTVDASIRTQNDYAEKHDSIKEANKKNKLIREAIIQGELESTAKLVDVAPLYRKEYVSNDSVLAAINLANKLVKYTYVKTELNRRNVHGNQQSVIVNNSMITNLINTLRTKQGLENYGVYKFQSRQYDFSNILVEHKDEKGNIINYGLFDENGNPTPYAHGLIQARLFDGASNTNTKENVLYAEMSKGDYIATAFTNFFNVEREFTDVESNINKANYFFRIPSDAPKNFILTAPKYSAQGLFKADGSVNTQHKLYKMFRQVFIQELTDAATAIDKIFDHTEGKINIDTSDNANADKTGEISVRFKEGFNNDNTQNLFAVYHKDKSGKIIVKDKLTGKVFHSDRFVITKLNEKGEAVVTNYGEQILEEAFDFLYGGVKANEKHLHIVPGDKLSIKLTDAQNAAIEKHLTQFIKDYVSDINDRLEVFKNFIDENLVTKTNIEEFALNYHLMYVGLNDLFEGDTKFYKDAQTFLKRAKEVQASGIPYGIINYNTNLNTEKTEIDNFLTKTPFVHIKENGTKESYVVKQYDKFTGVTIKNTIRSSEETAVKGINGAKEDGVLTKKLKDNLVKSGLTEDIATQKARDMMMGYHNVTTNDAQSYITFEEWIRRISARGQLNKYKPLIDAILDETKPVDVETINEFIQVQKNFYYDQHYYPALGITAPRQIKNAEFVLVPRFIKGTQLADIYDIMKKHDIDQLNTEETSKAGKVNVLTLWNNNGELTDADIKNFDANVAGAKELYSYNYLYTQQETPQHMNAANKAGIQIMKKILDNIDENSPLYSYKQQFFDLYTANIHESFTDLMGELDIECDENGNIILDDSGNIKGLDYKLFFDKLKEEVSRLGLDSNMLDYVTLREDTFSNRYGLGRAITKMPTFMNLVHSKLESIAQSVFNSRITRQRLPGFHAAQITNVGWTAGQGNVIYKLKDNGKGKNLKEELSEEEYNKLPTQKQWYYTKTKGNVGVSKDLRYHPNGEPYIEVLVPKNAFNFELTDKNGKLKTDEELLQELQEANLDRFIGYRIPTEGKQSVAIMKIKGFTDSALGSTIVVPDGWVAQTGSDFDIDSVYAITKSTKIESKTGKIQEINYEETPNENNYFIYLQDRINKTKNNKKLKALKKQLKNIRSNKELKLAEKLIGISNLAKEEGLPTYEQYTQLPINKRNNKQARSNKLLDCMIEILSHDASLEENLSRSNFEKIIEARDNAIDKNIKIVRDNRSPYNFLDQADYQEDVMSGAKLKAVSVVRDTFCSICNTVKPIITEEDRISILYLKRDGYNLKNLQKRFNNSKHDTTVTVINEGTDNEGYVVNHNKFGWSKDNKNIDGYLITAYSSQTTAHILDAVKEGSIPNLNDFTFQIYKCFPDIGSNYETGVRFIMQPGVTEIVKAYNAGKSIYTDDYKDPINSAIISLAKKILPLYGYKQTTEFNDYTSVDVVINILQKYNQISNDIAIMFGAAKSEFKIDLDNEQINKLLFSSSRLNDRLKNKGIFQDKTNSDGSITSPVKERLLFDLGVVLQYYKLSNFSSKISSYARVCNPDKFGAKQTIFETNKVFEDIQKLNEDTKQTLLCVTKDGEGTTFLNAIYPDVQLGLNGYLKSTNNSSSYPPLHYFLKYATAVSIKINRNLFETQSPVFIDLVNNIKLSFTHNKYLTEDVYNDYQNYIINHYYQHLDAVKYPITVDVNKKGFYVNVKLNNETDETEYNKVLENEKRRIFGYGHLPSLNVEIDDKLVEFSVKNINDITQEEVDTFAKLSPAQKIFWIKANYINQGVFKYIDTNLSNEYSYKKYQAGAQTIKFVDSSISIEAVYDEFNKAFYNNNPLIALAALDVIKYSFAVESFKMRRNGVTKMISNQTLIDNDKAFGTSIVDQLLQMIGRDLASNAQENLETNYIRSHSTINQVATKKVQKTKSGYELSPKANGIITLNNTTHESLILKYNIGYRNNKILYTNKFVKLKFGKNTILYKIQDIGFNEIVLYPLNLLEETENTTWSINESNNIYPKEDYYKQVISEYQRALQQEVATNFLDFYKEDKTDATEYKRKKVYTAKLTVSKEFDLNNPDENHVGGFSNVVDKIKQTLVTDNKAVLYLRSNALSDYIKSSKPTSAVIQEIDGVAYKIQKVNTYIYDKNYLNKKKEPNFKKENPQIIEIYQSARDSGVESISNLFSITKYEPKIEIDTIEPNESSYIAHSSISEYSIKPVELEKEDVYEKVVKDAENILKDLTYFVQDENKVYHSIDDDYSINIIKTNPVEQQRFLKTLLEARKLIKLYGVVNELSVEGKDEVIQKRINKLKEAINKLQTNSIINRAEERFGNEFLAKLSKDPLIQDGILSVFDGYHSAGLFDAWVNDLQETSNPLLQIVTKQVMNDIFYKETLGKQKAKEFISKLDDIKKRAKEAGITINWNNIIDESGKFVQEYNQAFLDKITSLREAMNEAAIKYHKGSIEYLKAKFEYDKFKLNFINQELVDDYYEQKLDLENKMITEYPSIYSAYKTIAEEIVQVLSHSRNGVLEDHYQNKLDELNKKKDALINYYYYDNVSEGFVLKPSIGDLHNPFTGEAKSINSIEAVSALRDYLEKTKKLRETYFTKDSKFGFEEELEKNLSIVHKYEKRLPDGRITTPASILAENEEYTKAKTWLKINAKYTLTEDAINELNEAFSALRENKQGRSKLSEIAKLRDAYDSDGIVDGRKLTAKDLEELKKDQLVDYGIRENQPYTDRTLISNAPKNNVVFQSSFYSGMKSTGVVNQDYIRIVNEINDILKNYYDPNTGILHTHEISVEDIEKLLSLYDEIENTKRTLGGNKRQIRRYIAQNVDFVTNDELFEKQKQQAALKGNRYLSYWQELCERIEEDENGNDVVVPTRYIFGYAVPKGWKADGSGNNSQVDHKKTKALEVIHRRCKTTTTVYYDAIFDEMFKKPKAEFNKWFNENHVYNPYTRLFEPLKCWTRLDIEHEANEGFWIPSYNQTQLRPFNGKDTQGKDNGSPNLTNPNYTPNRTLAANYKNTGYVSSPIQNDDLAVSVKTSINPKYKDSTNYNSDVIQNDYEKDIKQLFQTYINELATVDSAKRFFDEGYMVARAKKGDVDAKFIAKEAAKFIGWIDGAVNGEDGYRNVDYAVDKVPDMPLVGLLKSKDSVKVNRRPPVRQENETDDEYLERFKAYEAERKDAEAKNLKVHKDLIDRNWESVMEDFIIKAAHYNAIQDNKYMLFYAKNMLEKIRVYVTTEGFNSLVKDISRSNSENTEYTTKTDTRLIDQYENWLRRLVYDQWKNSNNKLTKYANIIQSMTSAKFMMFNVTGGIANVTLGETQILGEAFAKEYFGLKTWLKGTTDWHKGIPSYLADLYSNKASSLSSAMIKYFNVVDFDELTGRITVKDPAEYAKRVRDSLYAPQAMGEHFMQNSVMFAMAHSYRIVQVPNTLDSNSIKYEIINEAEYTKKVHEEALLSVLPENKKSLWNKFKQYELSDDKYKKDYAWRRKDLVTQFVQLYLTNDEKIKFNKKEEELRDKKLKEFNDDTKHPTLISQLKLTSDGELGFEENSVLANQGQEAFKVLAEFRNKVISVNKKIHGVYDKLGAAKIESAWFGGLVMQYHKHIYPGIMKRYRRKGYFNEQRGTIEKGTYASIKDFLSLPLQRYKFAKRLQVDNNMSDAELQSIQGIQNLFKGYVDFLTHISVNFDTLPENEKANIRRALGDISGVLAAICTSIALRVLADDDDEQGFIYNLFMYEADRLASESFMYNPLGLYSEAKKLWSSPIAAQSFITDSLNTIALISQWIIEGEDFNPYYETGLYTGEHKLTIKLKRNIPVYHSFYMLDRLEKNNRYYKLGENMLSIIPVKEIAESIKKQID